MNEQIRELAIKAGGGPSKWYTDPDVLQEFAELIVAECNKISKETCNELVADESIQTPGSKINWHLYNATLRNKLADHFWVEL